FLDNVLDIVRESYRQNASDVPPYTLDVWHRHITEAALAVGTYNQTPVASLERLFLALIRELG
ncbi:MAG: hypothetical protein LBB43_04070, partial [Spirochaetaceae bacterium]|nr:hypothetical protein [Spirochaetaceae bacterium]